jgi:hypothetical protein
MADNETLNQNTTTGAVVAADEIAGAVYQRIKLIHGIDGSNAGDVSTTNPLPVDVESVTPGTGATDLGKAEDAAHSSGATGVMALGVQLAADAALASDGDYAPLQVDDNGFLKVNIKAGAGSGGTASTDDAAFTAAAGSGTPMMGFVTSDSVDSGDTGVVGMLANRQLKVTLYDSGGVETAIGGGTQYTEDAAATANPIGNAIIVVRNDARSGSLVTADGDNIALRGTNNGELYVKQTDSVPTAGDVAHSATDSGNPVKIGYKAIAIGADPTPVDAGERTDGYANRHGVPFVMPGHPNVISLLTNYTSAQTDAALITVGTGNKIVVTRCSVMAANSNTVDTVVRVGFGSASTPATTSVIYSHPGLASAQIHVEGNGGGILGMGTDGQDLRITSSVPTGGSIDIVVSYYILPS